MNHNDHVNLLRPADIKPGGSWADLGAGSGAFTFATRELTGPTASIYAVDKDRASLNELEQAYRARFGDSQNLKLIVGDFHAHARPSPSRWHRDGKFPALLQRQGKNITPCEFVLKTKRHFAHRRIQRGLGKSVGALSIFVRNLLQTHPARKFQRAAITGKSPFQILARVLFSGML